MTAHHKPPLTDELLRRAWRDVRRPGWGSFEAALADPVHGGLIRARAHQLAHGPPAAPRHGQRPVRWPFPVLRPAPARDAKRAAAGDDDPDTQPSEDSP